MSKKSNRKTSYSGAGKIRTILMLIAVCLVVVMTVSACRPSDVLVEEIYKSIENEIDEEEQQLDPEDEGEEDEQFERETRDEADTERDVEEKLGQNDQEDTAESADNSVQMNQNDNAGSSDDSSGDSSGDSSDENQNTGSSDEAADEGQDTDSAETEETETSAGDSDEQDDDDDGTGSTDNEGGGDTGTYATFTIADARYEEVYIPENIEHVAAVGGAAQFVEMIGGTDKLYATDSVLKSSSIANSVFDLSGTITAFDGSSCTDFDALIAAIEDGTLDVIFIISDDTRFTSEQLSVLESYAYTGDEDEDSDGAHVAVIYLYSMYSLDGLTGNAQLMDLVFSKSDTDGAPATGAEYAEWVNDITSSVSGYDERTGLYIAGWDSSASYTLLNGSTYGFSSSGTGVAYAYTLQKTDQILISLMEKVNVVNSSTGLSTAQSKLTLRRSALVSDYAYIAPLFKQLGGSITPGGSVDAHYYDYNSEKSAYSSQWIESQEPSVQRRVQEDVYHVLGNSSFPAIITANSETKSQIEASIFWQNYEASNSQISPYGVTLYQIIYGDYEIYVNPAGMLDWCEGGSVEAPLEMLFIAYVYQGGSDITEDVADFYSTFFGCSDALASSLAATIMKGN